MTLYRRLLSIALLLAFGVIALGAWVRLSDAGLGCPDWPGCYGHWLGVPEHAADPARAWKEMIHRYFAGGLGLLILALCLLAWRHRRQVSPVLPTTLALLVAFQALLGMWTVTLLLKPLVVSAHLLGGMATLSVLAWLRLQDGGTREASSSWEATWDTPPAGSRGRSAENRMDTGSTGNTRQNTHQNTRQDSSPAPGPWLQAAGLAALLLIAGQIGLGGWVSSNYAALACPDFPTCQGAWLPAMDFPQAFSLHRELGQTADGAPLSGEALTAIHWSHRLGALAVILAAGGFALALLKRPGLAGHGWLLLTLLALQVGLGIANVLLALPLSLAVAHNAGAALLLAATVAANIRLRHRLAENRMNIESAAKQSTAGGARRPAGTDHQPPAAAGLPARPGLP